MASSVQVKEIQTGGSVQYKDVGFTPVPTGVVPAAVRQYVTQSEQGFGAFKQTVLTIAGLPVTVGNTTGVSFGGTKIFTFPEGRIYVLGSTIKTVTFGLTNAGNATPIDGVDGGDFSLGTTVAGDGTLTGTDVDILPATGIDPISDGVAGATLAAAAFFDGTGTAKDIYFNILIDDADVEDATSDVLEVSAISTITWISLGDY